MENGGAPEEGFADDIVRVSIYDVPLLAKKDFLPWHQPRKQFVRQNQWCEQIERMLEDMQPADNVLRYLGLPGVDLLDLRHFHTAICLPRNLTLRFLGFNTAANPTNENQTELNISLDEVRRLEFVDPRSDVIADDFTRVANDTSLAWKRALALGPYDVINLDLCDGFGLKGPDTLDDTHYKAVNRLMSLQARTKTPWLLLLTTRVGDQHVHPDVLKAFLEKYLANLTDCPPFKDASGKLLAIEDQPALQAAAATGTGALPLFLCGLTKWLFGLALEHQPPTLPELRSVLGYRVDHGVQHEDLISLAIRFTPTFQPTPDPLGLGNQSVAKLDECALSVKVLNRVAKRRDVDAILKENAVIVAQMVDATANLLAIARYDPDAYRAWVQALNA